MGIRELLNSAALVAALVVVPECLARAPSRQQPVSIVPLLGLLLLAPFAARLFKPIIRSYGVIFDQAVTDCPE